MTDTNNTNVSLNEHLSALLDDEAGAFEQRRVLDELTTTKSSTANKELCEKLASYSLIGESMRSASSADATMITGSSFLAGIHDKIDAEPEYHQVQLQDAATSEAKNSSWLRPIGGFALAASVAAIAVIGVQNYQQNPAQAPVIASVLSTDAPAAPQKTQLSVAAMKSATVVSAAELVEKAEKAEKTERAEKEIAMVETKKATGDKLYRRADARTRALLKRYVDSHMQFASNTTFVPSVRVIAYSDY
ncbi:MAG TPA: hypothetical protein EYG71_00220 [Leucothrix sp.]|nr:hypothetical protein [Leucothrix sp.]